MAGILIKNGRVWDGNSFGNWDILTDENKIIKMAPEICEEAAYIYDAKGKIVTPGLVDTHVHMRGISVEKFGIQGEMSCFPFGVTAAADAGGKHGDKNLLDSFMLKNVVFVPVDIQNNRADFTNAKKKLREYGDKAIGLKVYFSAASSQIVDTAPLRQICDFAHARGLRVMVHCTSQPVAMARLLEVLHPGDILTHAFHGGKNNAAEDGFASLMQAQNRSVIIDAGFAGHIHTDFGVFRQAIQRGILPDTISTDITRASAYKRGGRYGMTMCMSMARTTGMQEADIFRAVTSSAAKALGKEHEWGCLAVGRTADIAIFDYTHEEFDLTDKAENRLWDTKGYRCVLTVSDGQIVYKY